MPSWTSRLLLLPVVAVLGEAQTNPTPERLTFEVASVRPHPIPVGFVRRPWSAKVQCPGMGPCGLSGNRFTETTASLTDLIMDAYSVRRYQIAGLPDWGDTGHDVYDIVATADGNPTLAQARRMLQSLLEERFHLKVHRETRVLPVYALVPGKGRPKLVRDTSSEASDDPNAFVRSWELVSEALSMFSDRPVVDQTGFEGRYLTRDGKDPMEVIELGGRMRPSGGKQATAADEGALVTQLQEKWGLKLEPRKASIEVVVIDHVERPSAN